LALGFGLVHGAVEPFHRAGAGACVGRYRYLLTVVRASPLKPDISMKSWGLKSEATEESKRKTDSTCTVRRY